MNIKIINNKKVCDYCKKIAFKKCVFCKKDICREHRLYICFNKKIRSYIYKTIIKDSICLECYEKIKEKNMNMEE